MLQKQQLIGAEQAAVVPSEPVSPGGAMVLSSSQACQFTSQHGQLSCSAQGTSATWIHLPAGNEEASGSFPPFACIVSAWQNKVISLRVFCSIFYKAPCSVAQAVR